MSELSSGIDRLYCEKMSGTKKSRPELDRMLKEIEDGDTIVIESLSRLGRSVKNLAELMEVFNSRNIRLISLKETIDTTSSTGRLLFTILSSLAQFERDVLVERTREGLNAARARGRCGGRPKTNEATVKKVVALYQTKQYTLKEMERAYKAVCYSSEIPTPNQNMSLFGVMENHFDLII